MSLDRYLAVAHPIRSMSLRTVQNTHRAILVMWAILVIFCIPSSIAHNVSYVDNVSMCTFQSNQYNIAIYQSTFFLSSFIIPISVIILLYLLMLKRLWVGGNAGFVGRNARSKKKVTRMILLVSVTFICCWIILQGIYFIFIYKKYIFIIKHISLTQNIMSILFKLYFCWRAGISMRWLQQLWSSK